jgi:hypothetical protein
VRGDPVNGDREARHHCEGERRKLEESKKKKKKKNRSNGAHIPFHTRKDTTTGSELKSSYDYLSATRPDEATWSWIFMIIISRTGTSQQQHLINI